MTQHQTKRMTEKETEKAGLKPKKFKFKPVEPERFETEDDECECPDQDPFSTGGGPHDVFCDY